MTKDNNIQLSDLKEGDRFKFPYENRVRYLSQKGRTEGYCPIEGDYGSAISGEEVYLLSAPVIRLENEQTENKTTAQDPRETDIIELCRQVLTASPASYYNPNGPDDSTCPFCRAEVKFAGADMADITHETECAYNIAKDLSTGLINKQKTSKS